MSIGAEAQVDENVSSPRGGDTYMVSVQPRLWLTDRIAWVIFASGVAVMFWVLYVWLVSGGYEDTVAHLLDRARLRTAMFFAAAALAISGPVAAAIGQWIARRAWRLWRKSQRSSV